MNMRYSTAVGIRGCLGHFADKFSVDRAGDMSEPEVTLCVGEVEAVEAERPG